MDWIQESLSQLKKEGLYRSRIKREGLLDFCGNDYLGLKDRPEVIEESIKVLKKYGLGSGASQLVSGYTEEHEKLETTLAKFKEAPRCLLFGSGYLANTGVIPVLAQKGDLILSDELNHASLIDGIRLSGADKVVFPHRDYDKVRDFLQKNRNKYRRVIIVSDSVFSMDGDVADLPILFELSEEFDTLLYVDDAHATGTIGEGRGSLRHFGLSFKENLILMGTLSKAVGSYGAFLCASEELINLMINRARSLIFTTSLPPHICAGSRKSIEIIRDNPQIVKQLNELTRKIYNILKDLPFEVIYHQTPIIPLIVGDERKALEISSKLLDKGILLRAIRYPTVPRGRARLRLTVSLRYTEGNIQKLIDSLKEIS